MSLLGIFPSAYIYIGGKRKTEKEIPIKTLKKPSLENASEAVRLLARRKICLPSRFFPLFPFSGGGWG